MRISVPEPGSLFLLSAGLIGMGLGRRRLGRAA
ncbi:MAG: PEP-CTERM sorting domain-containing protein [Pseudomonadales bacterium]|nr:PEP-CTERM sorting domain-containing protein [Pseudomonadales bacterium]MCP5333461.1 PEP-CTERM sorting domain-containing protein [Pseudomonadales bacterium]